MRQFSVFVFAGLLAFLTTAALANSHVRAIKRMLPQLHEEIIDAELLDTLRETNRSRKHYTEADIQLIETAWQAQIENPNNYLVDNPIAARMRQIILDSAGKVTQIEIIDAHGIAIAQSSAKPDIWLGDERRWRKTFLAGPGQVFIEEIQFDPVSHSLQAWVNISIEDPLSGRAIGAIAIGFNVEALL